MAFGINIWDASGKLVFGDIDLTARVKATTTISLPGGGNVLVSVPGFSSGAANFAVLAPDHAGHPDTVNWDSQGIQPLVYFNSAKSSADGYGGIPTDYIRLVSVSVVTMTVIVILFEV